MLQFQQRALRFLEQNAHLFMTVSFYRTLQNHELFIQHMAYKHSERE